jgi:hypothetical protein
VIGSITRLLAFLAGFLAGLLRAASDRLLKEPHK